MGTSHSLCVHQGRSPNPMLEVLCSILHNVLQDRTEIPSIEERPDGLSRLQRVHDILFAARQLGAHVVPDFGTAPAHVTVGEGPDAEPMVNDDSSPGMREKSSFAANAVKVLQLELAAAKVGDFVAAPLGWSPKKPEKAHTIFCLWERTSADEFAMVVCNTGDGVQYHPTTRSGFPKMKCRAAVRLEGIDRARLLNQDFLFMLTQQLTMPSDTNTSAVFYEVLLPHLVDDQLQAALARTPPDKHGDFCSVQKASRSGYRCILAAARYLVKRFGFSGGESKQVFYALRVAFMNRVLHDLLDPSLRDLVHSDFLIIELGCKQLCMAAVKQRKRGALNAEGITRCNDLVAVRTVGGSWLSCVFSWSGFALHVCVSVCVCTCVWTMPLQSIVPSWCCTPLNHGPHVVVCVCVCVCVCHQNVKRALTRAPRRGEYFSLPPALHMEMSAPLLPLMGFDDIVAKPDTNSFAGGPRDALPELFVDMDTGSTLPTCWMEIEQCVSRCATVCDKLRAKAAVTAASLGLHQVVAVVQHTVVRVLPPLPVWDKDMTGVWVPGTLTLDSQRTFLRTVVRLFGHFVSAFKSIMYDRGQWGAYVVTCSKLLLVFEHVVRLRAQDTPSALSQVLFAPDDAGDDSDVVKLEDMERIIAAKKEVTAAAAAAAATAAAAKDAGAVESKGQEASHTANDDDNDDAEAADARVKDVTLLVSRKPPLYRACSMAADGSSFAQVSARSLVSDAAVLDARANVLRCLNVGQSTVNSVAEPVFAFDRGSTRMQLGKGSPLYKLVGDVLKVAGEDELPPRVFPAHPDEEGPSEVEIRGQWLVFDWAEEPELGWYMSIALAHQVRVLTTLGVTPSCVLRSLHRFVWLLWLHSPWTCCLRVGRVVVCVVGGGLGRFNR